jgi:hypothetical protein
MNAPATAFRAFAAADLATLAALQACPRPAGWSFHCERDETFDLIAVQPPTIRRHHDPLYRSPCYTIVPAEAAGVLMTKPDGRTETAYPSLAEAMRAVGTPGVAWKRSLGRG